MKTSQEFGPCPQPSPDGRGRQCNESSAQVRSDRPASVLVPSVHAVSAATEITDSTCAIGVLFSSLAASGLILPRTRLTNRVATSTTKATGTNSHPGIEPGPPPLASTDDLTQVYLGRRQDRLCQSPMPGPMPTVKGVSRS